MADQRLITTRDAGAPRVVLVSPKRESNVGAVARAMANFGLDDLWLVAPRCRLGREAAALAVHGAHLLKSSTSVPTLDDAVSDRTLVVGTSARQRAFDEHAAVSPETAIARLHGQAGALVFGPEDFGLDNAALDRCDLVITIPTAAYASLNLAQATVLLAYLWFRDRSSPAAVTSHQGTEDHRARAPSQPPQRGQLEAMLQQFEELALRSGYSDELRRTSMMRHMRRILRRAAADADDVTRLRGLWSQLGGALERAERATEGVATPAAAEDDTP